MKKTLTLALATCLAFCSCEKNDKDETTTVKLPDPNAMKYSISNIADMTLDAVDDSVVVLGITHTGGKQEKLTLSVIDLPANVSAIFETPSGTPSFSSKLTYKTSNATGGSYPVKIKAVTASDSIKYFDLTLKINPAKVNGCADDIKGTFTSSYGCKGGGTKTATIETTGTKDQVKISNFGYYPHPIIVNLDCNAKTFSIPQTIEGNFLITGSGNFSDPNKIVINYSGTDGTGAYSCTSTLQR